MARGLTGRSAAQPAEPAPPLKVNGWTLLFHAGFVEQLRSLAAACRAARAADPHGFRSNANVKVFAALAQLVLNEIPADPSKPEYRQGNTLGKAYRDWFRAKFFQRFRLFFRYHTKSKVIVFAWVNDENTLRTRGARNDPYEIFSAMLDRGNPPPDWDSLVEHCSESTEEVERLMQVVASGVVHPARKRR